MTTYKILSPTYKNLTEFLGNKPERIIGNNTTLINQNGTLMIKYHYSIIAALSQDALVINPCGWYTSTTKDRINYMLKPYGLKVYQKESKWVLWNYKDRKDIGIISSEFELNIRSLECKGLLPLANNSRKEKTKQIKAYALKYVENLLSGSIDRPSSGDCLYCQFDGLLDTFDHIESHIEESYFVPSLLVKAVKFYPVSILVKDVIGQMWYASDKKDLSMFDTISKRQISASLIKYMLHCYDQSTG